MKNLFRKDVRKGWILAPTILAIVSGAIYLFWPGESKSEPYVFLGLDKTFHDQHICAPDSDPDLVANLGFGANLFEGDSWELNAQYSHLSCAFDVDRHTYDGVGLQLRWFPTRWGD